jgi:uncharacterized protein YuzE
MTTKQEKTNKKFLKELKSNRKKMWKIFKPCLYYDEEYDIFYFGFKGNRKIEATLELSSDMRFDYTKKLDIVGIEIENFSKYLKEGIK